MTNTTAIRANRVSVQSNDQGGYSAKFHRTHKLLTTIESQDTTYLPIAGMNKTADREMFRIWICENAPSYGILWDPADRRTETNTLPAKYTSDGLLGDSAKTLVASDVESWIAKLEESQKEHVFILMSIISEDITPTEAYKGRVVAPKYGNGNWAYAKVRVSATVMVDAVEGYVALDVDLVSGQLKKPSHIGDLGYTYTGFITEMAKDFPFITAKKVVEATTPVVITEAPVEDVVPEVPTAPEVPVVEAITEEAVPEGNTPEIATTRKTRRLGA